MTAAPFSVHPTSRYKRLSTKLQKGRRDFEATEKSAIAILQQILITVLASITSRNSKAFQLGRVNIGFPSAAGVFATTSLARWYYSLTVASGERTHTDAYRDYENVAQATPRPSS